MEAPSSSSNEFYENVTIKVEVEDDPPWDASREDFVPEDMKQSPLQSPLNAESKLESFQCVETVLNKSGSTESPDEKQIGIDCFPRKCDNCSFAATSRSDLELHQSLVHPSCRFTCQHCSKEYKRIEHLNEHIDAVHLGKKYTCQHCSKDFKYKQHLKVHIDAVHLGKSALDMPNPPKKLKRLKRSLTGRRERAGKRRAMIATRQDEEYSQREYQNNLIYEQTKRCRTPRPRPSKSSYKCQHCPKEYKHRQNLIQHVSMAHFGKRYTCIYCSKEFLKMSLLKSHKDFVHLKIIRHTCQYCSKEFRDGTNLRRHIKSVHFKERQICKYCSKEYSDVGTLNCHINSVHLKKRYSCQYCFKEYSGWSNLRKHVKNVHLMNTTYTCKYCSEEFLNVSLLKAHEDLVHLKITRHACEYCSKEFRDRGNMRKHIKAMHLKDRQTCQYCSKVYSGVRSLNFHINSVHLKKRYSCGECSFGDDVLTVVKLHRTREHGIKEAFNCSHCPRVCASERELYHHIKRYHFSLKPRLCFGCLLCDYRSPYRFYVMNHMKGVHLKKSPCS